jgi:ATP-dependent helicase HrpB
LELSLPLEWNSEDEAGIGTLLARAFPGRIAKRQAAAKTGEGIFRFISGREGRIRSPLAGFEWLCALDLAAGERMGFIHLAVPVSEAAALESLKPYLIEAEKTEWQGLVPRRIVTQKAGKITLSIRRRPCLRTELLQELPGLLRENGITLLPWDDEQGVPRRLLQRIRFFAANLKTGSMTSGGWTDDALITDAAEWLGPFISGKGAIINGKGLSGALVHRLGWEAMREMDRLVPDQFVLPSGKKRTIEYGSGEPVMRLRLQDAFGLPGTCELLSVPVVFHLLSPADRPIQITRDLGGFWAGSYAEVRKEMRGRYPKHQWPENPLEFHREAKR